MLNVLYLYLLPEYRSSTCKRPRARYVHALQALGVLDLFQLRELSLRPTAKLVARGSSAPTWRTAAVTRGR